MKNIFLLPFSILCFMLLFTVASAQESNVEPTAEQLQRNFENVLQRMQSPRQQIHWEGDQLGATRSTWNGQGSWMPLGIMMRSGGEAELGLTNEQKGRLAFLYLESGIADGMRHLIQLDSPEIVQAIETAQAAELPEDHFFERATEEQKNAFREATIAAASLMPKIMQREIEETLTPEQMLAVRKLEMQLMSEMGIPFPSMFAPLDLTDEQRTEMNEIADEMKAEFERLTMEEAVLKGERLVAAYGSLQGISVTSSEEFQRATQNVHREFVPSEEMRRRSNDLRERGIQFVTLLQHRLMDVLTDEQLDRMQQILDETPETVKQMLAQMRASRDAQRQSPRYVPGSESWRPGMPLPVQFRQERNTRGNFPRPAN